MVPEPKEPQPKPVKKKIDWDKWGMYITLFVALVIGSGGGTLLSGYIAGKLTPPAPQPNPVIKVEEVQPDIENSIAETNGKRNDAIKADLVSIVKAGNGVHTLTFQPDKMGKVTWSVTVTGGVDPKPPVPPEPGPGPDPKPPVPPEPAPIPSPGFRVLFVYENNPDSAEAFLTKEQRAALYSPKVTAYLDSKCAKGPDGKTPEWRRFDPHQTLDRESSVWVEAMKRPRNVLPWVLISDGKVGHEGPLPENEDALLELLKKYGGA